MRFTKKLLPAILTATLLIGATGSAAWADTTPPQPATLHCADGLCTIETPADKLSPLAKLGATLGWSALRNQPGALPAGASLQIDDQVTLTLPVGELTLPTAQLDVQMGDDNRIARLRGSVETPFPTLGVLSDVRMVQPARAEVGLDTGANLSHLGAPLDAERQYLFFNIASGMDMAGTVASTGDALNLSAPAGQVLTLVIDTAQPLVYLAGNVTVNTSADMLLAGPLLELAQQSPLIPDALPLRQRTQLIVSGLAGKNADESLQLGGAWSVDAGALGRWLGVEATPLAVEGLLTLGPEGMLVDGVVRSAIAPDTVLDSSVQLTAFVPFKAGAENAFVETQAALDIPLANVDLDGSARIELPLGVADTAMATAGRAADSASNALQNALTAAGQAATTGADAIRDAAGRGGAWLGALPKPNLANIQLPRLLAQQ